MAIHANSTPTSVVHPGLLPPGAAPVPTPDLTAETVAMLAAIPAELPPLTAAFSRRRAIFGGMALAALPLAFVPALAAPSPDKMVDLYQRAKALIAFADDPATSEQDHEDAVDRSGALEAEAIASRPTTMAGAIACLEWARWDHIRSNMPCPDNGDMLVLALIEGALDVLRKTGALA